MVKKELSTKAISERLSSLKALRYWEVKWGYGKIKLYYPRSHRAFAEKFRESIESWLKFEKVMPESMQVILIPKK